MSRWGRSPRDYLQGRGALTNPHNPPDFLRGQNMHYGQAQNVQLQQSCQPTWHGNCCHSW
jgi:hypothetical protein